MEVSISVVVPSYNCESYVDKAISSIVSQHTQNVEIIVVDDGSTDCSMQRLRRYDNAVTVIGQENRGVAAARNRGLELARGRYLAFLDADDWWLPSRLPAQIAALRAFPDAALVFSDFLVADQAGATLMESGIRWKYRSVRDAKTMRWNDIFESSVSVEWSDSLGRVAASRAYSGCIFNALFRGNFVNTSSVLVLRKALEDVGGFDESLGTEEDYDLWLRIASQWPAVYVDEPLVAFRRRQGQLTSPDQIEAVLRNVLTVVSRAATSCPIQHDDLDISGRVARLRRDLGLICLRNGRNRQARDELGQCIHADSGQGFAMILYLVSFAPIGFLSVFEKVWRKVRAVFRVRSN